MRPLPGNDAWPRCQRPGAYRDTTASTMSTSNSQMSFVFADEASVDSYIEQSNTRPRFIIPRKPSFEGGNNTFSAYEDDSDDDDDDDDGDNEPSRPAPVPSESDYAPSYSPMAPESTFSRSPGSMISHQQTMSRPMTPMMLGTSVTGSVISSPSRRDSFTYSLSEHAISLDEEDHAGRRVETMAESSSAPQFIMPSIKMPSRRPFTATGKSMGRLKVLVAGDSGIGKTSLIKSIVQTCEHIVHVDPIGPIQQASARSSKPKGVHDTPRTGFDSKAQISEIFASTKPYPDWWSELDESILSSRRRSLGDNVLERNICFVDTPGYRNGSSAMETIVPCVEYVESHLDRVSSDTLSEPDMLNMLGGGGGFQVDAVLYLISSRLKPADLEYMRRLVRLTNVIPLLAQADKLPPEQVATTKEQIAGQLRDAHIRVFSFTPWSNKVQNAAPITAPYAVSSATGSDHDIMDASLLMSPDYVQPLMSTELAYLVEHIFSLNGTSWLRHAAAKKYLQWRNVSPSRPRHLYRPLSPPGLEFASGLTRESGALIERPSLALMRTYDQSPVDSLPYFQVADWAAELQRSLASERAGFEALARGERAVWLTERLNECVRDGTLVAVSELNDKGYNRKSKGLKPRLSRRTEPHQDPLGLLQVAADFKTHGWMALELAGSIGVLGGLAFWLSKHQWHFEPVVLADEWARVWGIDI